MISDASKSIIFGHIFTYRNLIIVFFWSFVGYPLTKLRGLTKALGVSEVGLSSLRFTPP